MGTKTIYGCVEWPSGVITFENEDCFGGDYTGCIEWTGDHAGQVQITFSEYQCESDTYYGCVNWSTGKFQVIIPDDCCLEYGNNCEYCAVGETPKYLTVTLSNISSCPCHNTWLPEGLSAMNGVYVIIQIESSCSWEKTFSGSFGTIKRFSYDPCGGILRETTALNNLKITVDRDSGTPNSGYVNVYTSSGVGFYILSGVLNIQSDCLNATASNLYSCCVFCAPSYPASGGNVVIQEGAFP